MGGGERRGRLRKPKSEREKGNLGIMEGTYTTIEFESESVSVCGLPWTPL